MRSEQIVEDTLQHFGILGMHWGHRKSGGSSVNRFSRKERHSEDHKKATELKKKKVSEMSNAELKSLNERLQLEKTYKDLSRQDISAGRKFVQDAMRDVGKELLKDAIKSGAKDIGRSIIDGTVDTKTNAFGRAIGRKMRG